jgi:peptidoglycan/LPS O-acetylase OafA/YrhL
MIFMENKPVHFAGLNTLRFFAAFSIVICHCFQHLQDRFPPPIGLFLHNLPLGVDLFFIISGFLIVYLLLEEKEKTGTISLYKFYVRRILRIFPLYFLVIGVAYFQYHTVIPTIDFNKFFYFVGNFWLIKNNNWSVEILNPLWSIAIEEHFYLFIPLLLLIISIKKINWLFFGIILGSIFYKFYISIYTENYWMNLYCHTFSRMDVLAIGGLLAYYYKLNLLKISINKIQFSGILILLIILMGMIDTGDFSTPTKAVFLKLFFVTPLVFIFIAFVLNQNADDGLIFGLKNNRILNYLGKISFGIYMFNSPIGDFFAKIHAFENAFLRIPAIILTTILVATLSYEFFEKQILKLKTRFEVIQTLNKI